MRQSVVLAGIPVPFEQLLSMLFELDLMPVLLRRHIERLHSSANIPSSEQQVAFQQAFLARERITDQSSLSAWLERQAISEPQMSQRLFHALQLELFKHEMFGPRVEPLFLERKSDLDRVTYSLLRVKDRSKALELHMRLQEEEATFAVLASTYSEGIEQQVNGLIGPMELGRINTVLAERLRISNPGQLWPPFETDGWWVILRLERQFPAQLDEAMTQRLLSEMYEVWILDQVNNALDKVKVIDANELAPFSSSPSEEPPSLGQAGEQPMPAPDLPPADALQPRPEVVADAHVGHNLLKSLFRRA